MLPLDSVQRQREADLTGIKSYEIFCSHIDGVLALYPKLGKTLDSNGKEVIIGEIDLIDGDQKHWDTYQISIHWRENYPFQFPAVHETGDKIPKVPDWHIYFNTGTCCFAIPAEEIRLCRQGITLTSFLHEIVLPYFFNQTHRKIEGYYKNGEFAHGTLGIYQYYADMLKTGYDIKRTLWLMQRIIQGNRPSRTEICFCGSREKFRRCHRDAFDKITEIGYNKVASDIAEIRTAAGIKS